MKAVYYQNPGEEEKLLYKPGLGFPLEEPVLTREAGTAGSLQFRIYEEHEAYTKIHPLSTYFMVREGDEEIFRGRNIGSEENFYRMGDITCEGDLNFLCDSVMRPYTHTGSIDGFMEKLLENHNGQVEERKQFRLGIVTVKDSNDRISRSDSGYTKSLEVLKDKLVDIYGGYLRTRKSDGIYYLDYIADYGEENRQKIRFGENLLDLTKYVEPSQIITALIPNGSEIEKNGEKSLLGIGEVNEGTDYIFNEQAVQQYGWIFGQKTWKDVTKADNLLKKAREYLDTAAILPVTMQLKAVDLIHTGADIQSFQVGYWTEVVSESNGVNGWYMLTKIENNLADPEADVIVLGGSIDTLTSGYINGKKDTKQQMQQATGSFNLEWATDEEIKALFTG